MPAQGADLVSHIDVVGISVCFQYKQFFSGTQVARFLPGSVAYALLGYFPVHIGFWVQSFLPDQG